MATITAPIARPNEDRIYVILAGLCAAIAFTAFAGTYWLQLPAGTFVGSPLIHLHGLLFSAWTLYFLWQAVLIATNRRASHRAWGLGGIALASAMVFTGIAVTIVGIQERIAHGQGEAGRAFAVSTVGERKPVDHGAEDRIFVVAANASQNAAGLECTAEIHIPVGSAMIGNDPHGVNATSAGPFQ